MAATTFKSESVNVFEGYSNFVLFISATTLWLLGINVELVISHPVLNLVLTIVIKTSPLLIVSFQYFRKWKTIHKSIGDWWKMITGKPYDKNQRDF